MGRKIECPVEIKKATFIWDNHTISVSAMPNLEGIKHVIITYGSIKGNELALTLFTSRATTSNHFLCPV